MKIQDTVLEKGQHEGMTVFFMPAHVKGDIDHKDVERGKIKRWDDSWVYVFYPLDYTENAIATQPSALKFT